ncbi:MAG: VCBS repeat-containing protein [Acidobacteriota bacterium]
MTTRQKVSWIIIVPFLVLLVAVPLTLHGLAEQDAEHARFYNSGKTINNFLSAYCKGWEAAFAGSDPAKITTAYSPRYDSSGRGRWTWAEEVPETGVAVVRRQAEDGLDYDLDDLSAETADYLATFKTLDRTICKIDLIETMELERSAVLTAKLIADGTDLDDRAFQDRHIVRWHLANEATDGTAYDWKIVRDELVHGVRVAGDRGGLVDTEPASVGIDFEHQRDPNLHIETYRDDLKFGVIQHASGGVSAADYDQDGRPDLLFLDGRRIRLYRNVETSEEGGVRFEDTTAAAGLDGIGRTHTGLFADFDNDGDRDLFLGRYLTPSMYFENDGQGSFTDKSAEMGLGVVVPSTSATLLDFDRDGYLDLYLGINGNAFEALPRLPFYAQNGQPNRLFRNDGGKGFVDVTEASGTGDVGWTLAVAVGDVDGDGWSDLAVANDFGRKNLYRNNQDGTFSEIAKQAGVLDFSGGMGLTFGDFNDDGWVDLYTSNINSNQRWFGEDMTVGQYIRNVMRSKWLFADFFEYWDLYRLVGNDWIELGQQIGEGNSLFANRSASADGGVAFEELNGSETRRAGWGWSVNFFDVDNDTDLDLYAANGWISNTPGTDL